VAVYGVTLNALFYGISVEIGCWIWGCIVFRISNTLFPVYP